MITVAGSGDAQKYLSNALKVLQAVEGSRRQGELGGDVASVEV